MGRRDRRLGDPHLFRQLVTEALESVPAEFRRYLDNVAVVIAEEPSAEDVREAGLDPREDTLYGLYHGTPLTERPHDFAGSPPDRITIYRGPLVRDCRTADDLRWEIECTVVHEIAHFFGLDDEQIEKLGY
jgi:predicted Zn-dependent protease with MMP-like domain